MFIRVFIFFVILFVYFLVVKYAFKLMYKNKRTLGIRFAKSLFLVIGFTFIIYTFFSQFEITKEVSKTLIQSGSLILAIATFSCQHVLGNVISGVVISISKPFDIGDKITLMNGSSPVVTGKVKDINIRHTIVQMTDGKHVIISNSLVDSYVCINENIADTNGYPLVMECSFDSDVNKAIKLMQIEIDNHPLTVGKNLVASRVTCSGVSPNGFELKAIIFTENIGDNIKACSDLRIGIFKSWKNNGIEIPFNTITLLNK